VRSPSASVVVMRCANVTEATLVCAVRLEVFES